MSKQKGYWLGRRLLSVVVIGVKRGLIGAAIAILGMLLWGQPLAWAGEFEPGAQLFEVHCVGCHVNGGNIVRRGKTLKQKALQRNGVDSPEAIANLIENGKNNMPSYRDRLTSEEINTLAHYVLERASSNWR